MKKIKVLSFALTALAFSVNAATLIPAKGVSILYINGQNAQSKIGKNEIQSGTNQLIVRMDKTLGKGSSGSVFTSDPYVLTFEVNGDEVKVNHPIARSVAEAEMVFKSENPQWRIEQDKQPLAYTQDQLQGKKGLLPFMGLDGLVADYNKAQGINFVDGVLVTTASAITVASASSVETKPLDQVSSEQASSHINAESQNLEQLKAWYLKSSAQERKTFRKWMIDQE
ncbi:DUF2057 domain-containing protein [Vibrio aestuarianus]|uniref:YccT family protein n=1 Tax=Vibrio aestuarianus TaxID=28171 RepID=UPI00237D0B01|nr:DUF2057 domain-containing protein [Vibrio aestuarianus]MDE1249956.1 DUF2057 domain-containing protein [Vibrio aestuarianus]